MVTVFFPAEVRKAQISLGQVFEVGEIPHMKGLVQPPQFFHLLKVAEIDPLVLGSPGHQSGIPGENIQKEKKD